MHSPLLCFAVLAAMMICHMAIVGEDQKAELEAMDRESAEQAARMNEEFYRMTAELRKTHPEQFQ